MAGVVLLLSGPPGIGKTTIVRDVVDSAVGRCGGFYTVEMLQGSVRTGFEIVTIEGKRAMLAERNNVQNALKVGSYRVNLEAIDNVAVPAITKAVSTGKIVVIDEIGPMEVLSPAFRSSVRDVLNNPHAILFGTIVERSCDFADEVKAHPRVELITITRRNRDSGLVRARTLLRF